MKYNAQTLIIYISPCMLSVFCLAPILANRLSVDVSDKMHKNNILDIDLL